MSLVRPRSPEAALLFTMVSSFFPKSIKASINSAGCPVTPNPPVMMVAPSGIAFKIGSISLVILFIISLVPFHP